MCTIYKNFGKRNSAGIGSELYIGFLSGLYTLLPLGVSVRKSLCLRRVYLQQQSYLCILAIIAFLFDSFANTQKSPSLSPLNTVFGTRSTTPVRARVLFRIIKDYCTANKRVIKIFHPFSFLLLLIIIDITLVSVYKSLSS